MNVNLKPFKTAKAGLGYVVAVVTLVVALWGQISAAADKVIADAVEPIVDQAIDAFKAEAKEQRAADQRTAIAAQEERDRADAAIQAERDRAQDLQNQQIQSMYDHLLGGD